MLFYLSALSQARLSYESNIPYFSFAVLQPKYGWGPGTATHTHMYTITACDTWFGDTSHKCVPLTFTRSTSGLSHTVGCLINVDGPSLSSFVVRLHTTKRGWQASSGGVMSQGEGQNRDDPKLRQVSTPPVLSTHTQAWQERRGRVPPVEEDWSWLVVVLLVLFLLNKKNNGMKKGKSFTTTATSNSCTKICDNCDITRVLGGRV